MKIKILFFLPTLYAGGAERVTITIMRLLDPKVFSIHLVCVELKGEYVDLIPEYVHIYNMQKSRTIFAIRKFRNIFFEIRPDIIFSTLVHTHIATVLSLLGMKKPILIFRSSSSPKLMKKFNNINFATSIFLNKAYQMADYVIAQTPDMKDEISQYYNVETNKIKTLINPLDTKLIDENILKVENPFKEKNKINVVASGRLSHEKGFDVLIRAFEKVVHKNSHYILSIIGQDQGELSKLKKIVATLKLQENVRFLGFQSNPYKYYYHSDVYVLSSRREGLPNTVLENMYLNKPVIATNCIAYLSSLIKEGVNGYLVDIESEEQLANAILNYTNLTMQSNNEIIVNDMSDFFMDIYKTRRVYL